MNKTSALNVRYVAGLSVFIGLVVALQILATYVRIGTFPITLTLVPIIVGSAVFGVKAAGILGATFGVTVILMSLLADPASLYLFNLRPFVFVVIIMARCILAALSGGITYKLVTRRTKNDMIAVVMAAVVTPIVNTGLFLATFAMFYWETLLAWSGGSDYALHFLFIVMVGANFLIEMGINVALSPAIKRIIDIRRKM
ncbi:MAG: hypothetical protein FWC95_02590 [Defluviitaleaceae bacterium]|nr:hypothetical protein [Defluviitaleaceae bacterium]